MTLDRRTLKTPAIIFHFVEAEDGEHRTAKAFEMLFEKTLERWKIRQSREVQL